jgi:hypothetical protein
MRSKRLVMAVLVAAWLSACGGADDAGRAIARGGGQSADDAVRVSDDAVKNFRQLLGSSQEEVVLPRGYIDDITRQADAGEATVRSTARNLPAQTRVQSVMEQRINNLRNRLGAMDEQTDGEVRQVLVGSACDAIELDYAPSAEDLESILQNNIRASALTSVPRYAYQQMWEELMGLYDDLHTARNSGDVVEVVVIFTACQMAG